MSGASGKLGAKYGGKFSGSPTVPTFNGAFDHGLGRPLRTLVHEAVVNLLQRLLYENGGYLNAVELTSTVIHGIGGGDEQGVALIYDQLKGRAPSIAVTTGDEHFAPAGSDGFMWTSTLHVELYFFVNSLRSRMGRLLGDIESDARTTADPGIHVIMAHALQLLGGQVPGGAQGKIKTLRPVRAGQVMGDDDIELWRQEYTVQLTYSLDAKRDIDLELKQIATYHRLAALQLATDDPIVTTSTVLKP